MKVYIPYVNKINYLVSKVNLEGVSKNLLFYYIIILYYPLLVAKGYA